MSRYEIQPDGGYGPYLYDKYINELEPPVPTGGNLHVTTVLASSTPSDANFNTRSDSQISPVHVGVDRQLDELLGEQGYQITIDTTVATEALTGALRTCARKGEATDNTVQRLKNMPLVLLNRRDPGADRFAQNSAGVFDRSQDPDLPTVPILGFWPDPENDIYSARARGFVASEESDAAYLTRLYTRQLGNAAVLAASLIAEQEQNDAYGGALGLRLEKISEASIVLAPAGLAAFLVASYFDHATGQNMQLAYDIARYISGGVTGLVAAAAVASSNYRQHIMSTPLFKTQRCRDELFKNLAEAGNVGQPLVTVTKTF